MSELNPVLKMYDQVMDIGQPGPRADDDLYVIGTWSGWAEMQEMERVVDGHYEICIPLGDHLQEQFQIVVNKDMEQLIYPVATTNFQDVIVKGPDSRGKRRNQNWIIDGRADYAAPGSIYKITLYWGFSWEHGLYKSVSWQRLEQDVEIEDLPFTIRTKRHTYSIVGSWTGMEFRDMVRNDTDDCLFETSFRIGASGQELFQIVRDHDWCQAIHPTKANALKSDVRIVGPDDEGKGKCFMIRGPLGDVVRIRFHIKEGAAMEVKAFSQSKGEKTWRSATREELETQKLLDFEDVDQSLATLGDTDYDSHGPPQVTNAVSALDNVLESMKAAF